MLIVVIVSKTIASLSAEQLDPLTNDDKCCQAKRPLFFRLFYGFWGHGGFSSDSIHSWGITDLCKTGKAHHWLANWTFFHLAYPYDYHTYDFCIRTIWRTVSVSLSEAHPFVLCSIFLLKNTVFIRSSVPAPGIDTLTKANGGWRAHALIYCRPLCAGGTGTTSSVAIWYYCKVLLELNNFSNATKKLI